MTYAETCANVLEIYREIFKLKLTYSTWGNVSARYEDGLIVTPSRIACDVMTPEDMVYLSFDGSVISGVRVPTSERDIHRLIIARRPDVNAVVHTHSPYACAAAAAGMTIAPHIEEIPQLIGGAIRCTDEYVPALDHLALAQKTADTMGSFNAVLIRNHGPMCAGSSLEEALTCALVTEKAAQIQLILSGPAAFSPIPDEYVVAERRRYVEKYGRE